MLKLFNLNLQGLRRMTSCYVFSLHIILNNKSLFPLGDKKVFLPLLT
jgi:hypothetical protein